MFSALMATGGFLLTALSSAEGIGDRIAGKARPEIRWHRLKADLPVQDAIAEFETFAIHQPSIERDKFKRTLSDLGPEGVVRGTLILLRRGGEVRIFQLRPDVKAFEMHGIALARRNAEDQAPVPFAWSRYGRVDANGLLASIHDYASRILPVGGLDALFDHAVSSHRVPIEVITPANAFKEESVGIMGRMVLIKPGAFLMGSPPDEEWHSRDERQRHVPMPEGYKIQATLHTVGQLLAFMPERQWSIDRLKEQIRKYHPDHDFLVRDGLDYPAVYLSIDEALAYAKRISEILGFNYKLPSEERWEYAARAGMPSVFKRPFGNVDKELDNYAWYYRSDSDINSFQPVAGKRAVGGLYDIFGNVREWVEHQCGDYDNRSIDKDPPDSPRIHIARSGAWSDGALNQRAALRGFDSPNSHFGAVGFRLVELPGP